MYDDLTSATLSDPPNESTSSSSVLAGRLSPRLLIASNNSRFIAEAFSLASAGVRPQCAGFVSASTWIIINKASLGQLVTK